MVMKDLVLLTHIISSVYHGNSGRTLFLLFDALFNYTTQKYYLICQLTCEMSVTSLDEIIGNYCSD